MYVLPIVYCLMQKHTPGMFLTDFRTRKYTRGMISRVDIFLTVTPVQEAASSFVSSPLGQSAESRAGQLVSTAMAGQLGVSTGLYDVF